LAYDWSGRGFCGTFSISPHYTLVIQGAKGWFNVINVKFNEAVSVQENLAAMEKIFKKYNPEFPFNYQFVDEQYAKKFNDEKRTETLAGLFASLAVIISCLGLFGLGKLYGRIKNKGNWDKEGA
jgi:putative ABC transport system permease protein